MGRREHRCGANAAGQVLSGHHAAPQSDQQVGPAQQKAKAECWEDMKQILARMGRPVPGGK